MIAFKEVNGLELVDGAVKVIALASGVAVPSTAVKREGLSFDINGCLYVRFV